MNPKLQLGISLFLLFVVTPGGVWAILHDLRGGETTYISTGFRRLGQQAKHKRERDRRGYWGMIIWTFLGWLMAIGLGAWGIYDSLRHI